MTLILNQRQVRELLPMATCMDLVADGLARLSRDEAVNPLRKGIRVPASDGGGGDPPGFSGLLGLMPGFIGTPPALGLKVVGIFHGNHGTNLDSHQGIVALFDTETGTPLVIMEGSEVTGIRTAAASGVATRLLARVDASELALIGSGVQARTHLEAMIEARPISKVRVYSRSAENREAFAARESSKYGIPVVAVHSARAAVEGADIVCTVTSSSDPVVEGNWIAPGAHVNAAGSSVKDARELDTEAVRRSRLFVDRRESTLHEAGDFLIPKAEGVIGEEHILGEIGELVDGRIEGRCSAQEVTLFKSLGVAVEDLVSAHHVLAQARARGIGVEVDLMGVRD